eukprot:10163383-Ditylum_brightwellii.AAC.1
MDPNTISPFDCSSTLSLRSNSLLQCELDAVNFTVAIEEIQLNEPNSTILVDDNPTNEADDDIVTWDDFVSSQSEEIPPKCGGFVLIKDDKLLTFIGTDPDAKAVKGPVNNGQYCLVNFKAIKLVEKAYTKYVGTNFEGLAGKDGGSPLLALSVYKDIIRKHIIENGMWDVFQFQLLKFKKMICLIENMGKVKVSEIKENITKIKSTAD